MLFTEVKSPLKIKQCTWSGWKVPFKLRSWMRKIEIFLALGVTKDLDAGGEDMSMRDMSAQHSIPQPLNILMSNEKQKAM